MPKSSKISSKKLTLHFLFVRFSNLFIWMYPDDLSRTPALKDIKGKGCLNNHYLKARNMLITISDACKKLSVSRSTVYRLIEEGKVRRIYVKGAPRISLASIHNLIGGE